MLQLKLIALYDYVCRCYDTHPCLHYQRQSNNYRPAFTDQELMTIHLFGLLQRRFTLRDSYDYICQHWASWFPQLPSYQAVNYRLNQIGWHFEVVLDGLANHLLTQPALRDVHLLDSLPIILSKRTHAPAVGRGWADTGYCATKKLYYHGLKLHLLATDRLQALPLPRQWCLSAASVHDLTLLRQVVNQLPAGHLIADKAYTSRPLQAQLVSNGVVLHTPPLRPKRALRLSSAAKLYATYVSPMRQPIESLFHWLIEQTQLQSASKVRSTKGVLLHCWGRLTAGLYKLAFNP